MRTRRVRRTTLGMVVVIHGLAHAWLARGAIWAATGARTDLLTACWSIALLGYVAGGMGVSGAPIVRHIWKQLLVGATTASMFLLMLVGSGWGLVGAVIDLVLLLVVFEWAQPAIDHLLVAEDLTGVRKSGRSRCVADALTTAVLVYLTLVVALRPVGIRWGTSASDRLTLFPGDELIAEARSGEDQAILIHSPADQVWPWVAQIGQDRAGFYSYAGLERLFGIHMTNAPRIHPEWQSVREGDFVRATQSGYLGGRFDPLGWRVTRVVPGRALVLDRWGTFAVQPVDDSTSRLSIRTRCECRPSLGVVFTAPVMVLLMEPAHLIMQRGMLLGVRDRAERALAIAQTAIARSR